MDPNPLQKYVQYGTVQLGTILQRRSFGKLSSVLNKYFTQAAADSHLIEMKIGEEIIGAISGGPTFLGELKFKIFG